MMGLAVALLGATATSEGLAAQEGTTPRAAERTIRVTGMGEVEASPDAAQIAMAVESFAPTAREAGEQNSRVMQQVIAALVGAGVPRDSIETRNFQLFPEYVHEPGPRGEGQPRIRGYRAMNQVVVLTTRLDRVGRLIDVALQAGSNRMEGVSFVLRDASAAQSEALRRAVVNARRDAETMARALGVALGPVLEASTTSFPMRPVPTVMARMEAASAMGAPAPAVAPPIQPGQQTVRATASLIFRILES